MNEKKRKILQEYKLNQFYKLFNKKTKTAEELYNELTPIVKSMFKIEEIIWIDNKDYEENHKEITEQCKYEKIPLIITTTEI